MRSPPRRMARAALALILPSLLIGSFAAPRDAAAQGSPAEATAAQDSASQAAAPRSAAATSERPRIGLVLGGGGAKGAAHIGVLRVLEELRIPIDCVAGTSMGALVGGTFAAGRSASEIETEVLAIDWSRTVGGQGRRDRTRISTKLQELAYSNPLEVGVSGDQLATPGGFIETQAIEEEIRGLIADARFAEDFDRLPIPFRAVATDMVAGELVVLDRGDLAAAMRASMAIPGAFSPVTDGDRVLADGGLMRNLPVDVARGLCADVVIAVWLTTPQPSPAEVSSALALVGRSLDVVIRANEREQIETLGSGDVGIGVAMGDITTADFQRTPEAIELGRMAAEAQRAELSRYSVSEQDYDAWRRSLGRSEPQIETLSEVRISGLDRVDERFLRTQLESSAPGATVSAVDIEADADRLYALGDFEQVDYRVTGADGARVLEFLPREKSWGPNFIRLNLGASTDGAADILGILRIDHTRTWLNDRGGQWHSALQIGGQSILTTDLYQPLDIRQRFFVQPIGYLERKREDLYLDGERVARYFIDQLYTEIDFGVNVGTRAQLRAGLRRGWFEARRDTGLPGLPELDPQADTSFQFRATYDTRDSVGVPTQGTFMSTRYAHGDDRFGGERDYDLIEGVVSQSFPFRGNSLSVIAGGGRALSGDVPATEDIQLGGIRTFPGLRPGELRGNSYWYAGTTYLWRLFDLQPLFGQTLYAGLRLQAGEMHDRTDGIDDGTLYGISGSIRGRTPVGPFELSLGFVDNGSTLLQFTIGRPVAEGSILDELY
jgi:NTE family protein